MPYPKRWYVVSRQAEAFLVITCDIKLTIAAAALPLLGMLFYGINFLVIVAYSPLVLADRIKNLIWP
jgi:hypothetical protein